MSACQWISFHSWAFLSIAALLLAHSRMLSPALSYFSLVHFLTGWPSALKTSKECISSPNLIGCQLPLGSYQIVFWAVPGFHWSCPRRSILNRLGKIPTFNIHTNSLLLLVRHKTSPCSDWSSSRLSPPISLIQKPFWSNTKSHHSQESLRGLSLENISSFSSKHYKTYKTAEGSRYSSYLFKRSRSSKSKNGRNKPELTTAVIIEF